MLQTSPLRGDAVAADDDDVDLAALHQVAAGVVGDQRMRNAGLAELPRRQARALVARARLIDPDVQRQARRVRLVDRRGGGAPVHRGEPAGIAVRQHAHRAGLARGDGVQQRQAVATDRGVDGHVVLADRVGLVPCGGGTLGMWRAHHVPVHAFERPCQVDRCRPRGAQALDGACERGVARVLARRERVAEGRRRADQRRAAQPHLADRDEDFVARGELAHHELMRQRALVDDLHCIACGQRAQRPQVAAADFHRRTFMKIPARGRPRRAAAPPSPHRAPRAQ